jgi:hypothetical protein
VAGVASEALTDAIFVAAAMSAMMMMMMIMVVQP